jgi:hypothetical protein
MSRFFESTTELRFCDRDLLPSFMRGPERERRPYGADAAETQRYFAAEDDLEYLVSADSRQDEDAADSLAEVLCGAWAELDADGDGLDSDEDCDDDAAVPHHGEIEVELDEADKSCDNHNRDREIRAKWMSLFAHEGCRPRIRRAILRGGRIIGSSPASRRITYGHNQGHDPLPRHSRDTIRRT